MLMNEIFDSPVEIEWVQSSANKWIGTFKIDNGEFCLILDFATFKFNGSIKKFVNCGLVRLVNDIPTTELIGGTKKVSRVIGTIIKGLKEKVDSEHVDALVVGAQDNIEKRMRLYNRVIDTLFMGYSMMTKFTRKAENIKLKNGNVITVLFTDRVPESEVQQFKHLMFDKLAS